jgi:hypothetical protein
MPKIKSSAAWLLKNARKDLFLAKLEELRSPRKVRPVVTRSGHRARGYFPSRKAERARYESLLELDALKIQEVAPCILEVRTHPLVLALPEGATPVHYTPDMVVLTETAGAVIEVKSQFFLAQLAQRVRLAKVAQLLAEQGLPFVVMTEGDIRDRALLDELDTLLAARPVPGRYIPLGDAEAWDPRGRQQPTEELQRRWQAAKEECDALLQRVMRRPPGEVLEQFQP